MTADPLQLLSQWATNPRKSLCELSLHEFVKQGWPQLEPGTPLIDNKCLQAICEHLQAVTMGEITKLVMNVPPGLTKSMATNVFWPAWEWGPRGMPHHRFISAGYEQGLPTRDLVRCRDLIKSEWYQERWPLGFKVDQDQKTYYENANQGWRKAASVRSALIGYRGDRIIIDDPHSTKTAESEAERTESLLWFRETLPTRFNDPKKATMVVIMQRLHESDISGEILAKLMSQGWVHLCLPMEYEKDQHCKTSVIMPGGKTFEDWRTEEGELLCPERFDAPSVEGLKVGLGDWAYATQQQQRPAPREGGMFKADLANYVDANQVPQGGVTVSGWDFAATSKKKNPRAAYTARCKLRLMPNGDIYILDVKRKQVGAGDVRDYVVSTAAQDGPTVFISMPQDPGAAGKIVATDFTKALQGYMVHTSIESGDKAYRADPLASQWNAGGVYLVRAEWNDPFMAEAGLFPGSTYKDQVDAATRAYAHAVTKQNLGGISLMPPTLLRVNS